MHLDDRELRDLAEFLARRFDPSLMPTDRDTTADWVATLHQAQTRGALPALLRRASAAAPDDANLVAATSIVAPKRSLAPYLAAAGTLSVAATAVFAIVVGGAEPPQQAVAATPTAAIDVPTPALSPPPIALQPQSVAPAVVPPVVALQPQSVAPSGPCQGRPDELLGWWYAGERRPGGAGDTLTVPAGANVRVHPPTAANHFDSKGAVRCVLEEGTRLRLTADPIRVPRNAWWVPLYGADAEAPGDGLVDATR